MEGVALIVMGVIILILFAALLAVCYLKITKLKQSNPQEAPVADYAGDEDPKQTRRIELFQLTSPHRNENEPSDRDVVNFTSEFVIPVENITT